jgi:hypothetical protein
MKLRSSLPLLLTLLCTTQLTSAQLPYYTGFDTPAEKQGWTMFRAGSQTSSTWQYDNATAYTAPSSLAHYYPVGGSQLTDDWFVSPGFSIPAGGKLDSIRHRFSGFGVPGTGDTVALYLLVGSANPSLASSKILLKDFRGTDYQNDGKWNSTMSINLAAQSSTCYLAVRYTTIINWLDVFIDNIHISGNPSTGIGEMETNNKLSAGTLYPNPVNDRIYIQDAGKQDAVFVMDATGKKIWSGVYGTCINVSMFSNGFYIIGLQPLKGDIITKKFYKK